MVKNVRIMKAKDNISVKEIIKASPKATYVIQAAPNRSRYFKQEWENSGNLLSWK